VWSRIQPWLSTERCWQWLWYFIVRMLSRVINIINSWQTAKVSSLCTFVVCLLHSVFSSYPVRNNGIIVCSTIQTEWVPCHCHCRGSSRQGSHTSLKVLEFFPHKFKALKILENKQDRCLKVLEFHSTGPWKSLNSPSQTTGYEQLR